ncbi:MAG: integrase, partial [Acetobacteraceae bacterium]|nr:integrase [Acetobacteraceae bacterium]
KSARAREHGRGWIASGGRGAASRTVGMLGTIMEFARRKRIIGSNPCRDIERLPERRQTRFLTLDEITKLGGARRGLEAAGASPVGLAAIRFLLLSGCRQMEALASR